MYNFILLALKDKNALISITLTIVHQLIIASSIFFLTNLILNYQKNIDYSFFLIMYLISMTIPYLPGCISFIYLQKWINNTHRKFIIFMKEQSNLTPQDFRNEVLKNSINALAARNSFSTINSSLSFLHDFITLFLNSVFSIVTIALLLPKSLAFGYIFSSLISLFIIVTTKKIIEKYHINIENLYINYSTTLTKISDNISIKNKNNEKYFNDKLEKDGNAYYNEVVKSQQLKQVLNIILAFAALIPTGYLVFHILILKTDSSAAISAIIVNLTRIFTLLSSLNSLLNYMIEVPGFIGQFKVLFSFKNIEKNQTGTVSGFFINKIFYSSEKEMQDFLLNKEYGRFTITGSNGSGKSTLLHNLKRILEYNSIFIPTNISNLYWGMNLESLSTGQKIKRILENTLDNNERFIILDEWDANLDIKNKTDISSLIDHLSETKVIIEVTHR